MEVREPRTPADNGGQPRTTSFLCFSLSFLCGIFKLLCFLTYIVLAVVTPVSFPEKPRWMYTQSCRLQMFQKRPFFCCRNFEAKRLRRHILLGPPDLFCSKTFFSVNLNARRAVGILGETLVQLGWRLRCATPVPPWRARQQNSQSNGAHRSLCHRTYEANSQKMQSDGLQLHPFEQLSVPISELHAPNETCLVVAQSKQHVSFWFCPLRWKAGFPTSQSKTGREHQPTWTKWDDPAGPLAASAEATPSSYKSSPGCQVWSQHLHMSADHVSPCVSRWYLKLKNQLALLPWKEESKTATKCNTEVYGCERKRGCGKQHIHAHTKHSDLARKAATFFSSGPCRQFLSRCLRAASGLR